jgi:non-heme chloroperoxidase
MTGYLYVRSAYPNEGTGRPPILLVHGAANAGWVWRFWIAALARIGWEAHALDLRGHGESAPAESLARVSMEDYVHDAERIAGHLSAPPIVFGWSMGGLVAQQYAARHPALPALVLLAPSPPLAVQGVGSEASIAEIPDLFGTDYYGLGSPAVAARVLDDLTPDEQAYILAHPDHDSGHARRQRKRGIAIDAAGIGCPVLLIHGERDRFFPPEVCAAVASYYGATLLPVAPARHWGIVTSEAIVAELAPQVSNWLRERIPPLLERTRNDGIPAGDTQ